ncbi:PLP-dependent aminotransferase family protein [Sphingobium sp. H39-3-25]|uniref:aminotransferase-like domain-containing protein n=1 Tax=Sphingobium arseniciresistens TaxID=3030834 RepID=UPI0023B9A305|nr:PLP-dependent aminotransferase family protein [Sphingobium arseniciresistens]
MAPQFGSKTIEVMEAIRAKVANRAFAVGDRLPSIRNLAATLSVSPSTVVEAYERLAAEGLVRARRGSGYYISASVWPALALGDDDRKLDRTVDPFWVSRQSLDANPTTLKPGCGWLPANWMPGDALRKELRSLARAEEFILTDYGSTSGSADLRRLLLMRFAEDGVEATPDQLMLTASGTQAIDLVCRLLLRPGSVVLVDDPCYFNFRALLRAHQAEVVGVPYTPTGPDIAQFEALVVEHRPRLYITNSALHNPTGGTLSPHVAHSILNIATAHDMIIVEDEIFADFEPEPSPRLAALDGLKRVIRIGSFSKTLSASIRCGYIATRAEWIGDLVDLQVAINFGGPSPIAANLIAGVLTSGGYRKHMDALRLRLVRTRREVADKLQNLGFEMWLMPRGGFFLWCRLPERLNAADLARAALADDIVLAPGDVFSVTGSASTYMRFNVAQSTDPRIWETMKRAIAASR